MATSGNSDNIEQIEKSRNAVLAASIIDPFIDEALQAIQDEIVSNVRGGQTDTNLLLTQAGRITALVMLRQSFEGAVRQGEFAAEQEYGNG